MAYRTSLAEASNSTSASIAAHPNDYCYDVFLNHRGPDTKKSFASLLYNRLHAHGVRAFLDKDELQSGDYISPQIKGAIRTASVHVAIFSEGYAESAWCLNELVAMVESGATIIPVFYNVRPSELRWTRGTDGIYGRALQALKEKETIDPGTQERRPRYDADTIQQWRNALSNVSIISGLELTAFNGWNDLEWANDALMWLYFPIVLMIEKNV